MAEGQAQHQRRRQLHAGSTRGTGRRRRTTPRSRSARRRSTRRPTTCSTRRPGNFPGGISTTQAGYARNLYGFLTGRVTNFAGTAYLQPDGTYQFQRRADQRRRDRRRPTASSSATRGAWKPNLTINAGVRYEVQLPMTTDGLYSRPQTWQMVYGITGAGSGSYRAGQPLQARHADRHQRRSS